MKKTISLILCTIMIISAVKTAPLCSAAEQPSVICKGGQCQPGDTVTVDVEISGNPGIMYLELTPVYPAEYFVPTVQDGGLFTEFLYSKQLIWTDNQNNSSNGRLFSITFAVGSSTPAGDYSVDMIFRSAFDYDETAITFAVTPATVSVVNGDIPLESIGLSGQSTLRTDSGPSALEVEFFPKNTTNRGLIWSSSNPSVATVKDGAVTPLKAGTVFITAQSEDSGIKASFEITVVCSHSKVTQIPEREANCLQLARHAYTVCDLCGEIVSGSNETYGTYGGHHYIENLFFPAYPATCVLPARYYKSCSICGARGDEMFEHGYIDPGNHKNRVVKGYVEPTETAPGYSGDIWCDDCNRLISQGRVIHYGECYGDADGNGVADASDALAVLKAAVGKLSLDEAKTLLCDVNGDGKITAVDAMLILQKSVGLIDTFPIEFLK